MELFCAKSHPTPAFGVVPQLVVPQLVLLQLVVPQFVVRLAAAG